ncbi:interferon-induced protein 44-like isoform X2 [Mercenaria mercenaria]|uniref:interferon-induced protein 44-like isoform X2 n=1 Tax=Mercenaria mercenaria TaxID=6596 RepID=UPI00234F69C1|nr:interferon-induced protein 44-like isoform X2 [Mercenaria mercenaria]
MFLFRPIYNQVSGLYYDPWRIPDACTLWQWKEEYRRIKFPGLFDSFTVGDVKGLTKEVGASSNLLEDLKLLIKGHIKPGYKFDATKPIATDDSFYIDNPNTAYMIHGVIIVFDITETYEIHAAHLNDIKDLTKKLHEMNIPISVMLTKADKLCRRVAENVEYIYHSKKVLTAVITVEKALSVPKKNIHPIVNFEDEISFGWKSSLPLLVALRACLSMAKCHLYNEQQKKGNAEAEAKSK